MKVLGFLIFLALPPWPPYLELPISEFGHKPPFALLVDRSFERPFRFDISR